EEQLRQSQKMEAIGRLAGGIAHDFNNLLTAIKGYGEFLLADLPEGSATHRDAQEIVLAADRAATLTRQLLAFSRRQTLAPLPIGLNTVVGDLEGLLRRLIGEQVEFVTELSGELPSVRADRGQLEQVIVNLVVNARDAMPGGGRLTISTGLDDGRALLQVSDTGVGMGAEVRARGAAGRRVLSARGGERRRGARDLALRGRDRPARHRSRAARHERNRPLRADRLGSAGPARALHLGLRRRRARGRGARAREA